MMKRTHPGYEIVAGQRRDKDVKNNLATKI
jgi:hypothetical protein